MLALGRVELPKDVLGLGGIATGVATRSETRLALLRPGGGRRTGCGDPRMALPRIVQGQARSRTMGGGHRATRGVAPGCDASPRERRPGASGARGSWSSGPD